MTKGKSYLLYVGLLCVLSCVGLVLYRTSTSSSDNINPDILQLNQRISVIETKLIEANNKLVDAHLHYMSALDLYEQASGYFIQLNTELENLYIEKKQFMSSITQQKEVEKTEQNDIIHTTISEPTEDIYGTDTVGNIYNGLPYNRRVNVDGRAKPHITLQGDTVEERTRFMLKRYGHDFDKRAKYSKQIGIKTEFAVCLARAETSLGGAKKTNHNYFNCGNNDRGDTITFGSLEKAFNGLGKLCLNGTYLKNKTTLSHLSPNHRESTCQTHPYDPACKYVFASSKENWMNNVTNCLGNIYQKTIEPDRLFRL